MIIGIDVAKATVVAVVIDRSTRIRKSFTIKNTRKDIKNFVLQIQKQYKRVIFASESTAEYHRELVRICLEQAISFRLLNPITTKQFTRATVRKKKTDVTDAHIIAKLALQGEGTLVTKEVLTLNKPAIRTSMKLSDMKRRLSLMQKRLERLGMNKILVTGILKCEKELQMVQETFETYAAIGLDTKLVTLLRTIPGIGPFTATALIAEIQDINKFSTGKSLVAFCGLDPKVRQSGQGFHHNTKITKRGSPYLRRVLYFSAGIASLHDKDLKEYYEKKRKEGRKHKEAVIATARKLLYRVFAVWKRQTPYIAL